MFVMLFHGFISVCHGTYGMSYMHSLFLIVQGTRFRKSCMNPVQGEAASFLPGIFKFCYLQAANVSIVVLWAVCDKEVKQVISWVF